MEWLKKGEDLFNEENVFKVHVHIENNKSFVPKSTVFIADPSQLIHVSSKQLPVFEILTVNILKTTGKKRLVLEVVRRSTSTDCLGHESRHVTEMWISSFQKVPSAYIQLEQQQIRRRKFIESFK